MNKKKKIEKFNFDKYDFQENVLISGPVGVGKTYTAKQILKRYNEKFNHECRKTATYFISDAEFKQLVKSNLLVMRKPEDWQLSILKYPLEIMIRAKLMVYDDIGVSDCTEAYLRDLTFILDKREEKSLKTIFTTNLGKSELQEKLNDRVVSRLLHNCNVIVFKGEDKRTKTTKYFIN